MRYISTTDTNITFTDTNGKVMVVPKNRVYTHFNVDTVTFLLIERYDNEGICIFTTIAEDLEINGTTYTYEQLLDGEGISDLFSPTGSLSYKIVDELPQTGTNGVIYLVPKGDNSYAEYLWIEDEERYEMLGDVGDIDLTDYYTKTQVDEKLVLKANASEVYTKTEADNKFLTEHQSLDNYYTKDEVYNKTESDAKYATQVVVNEEIAARIQGDADINTALGTKADKSDTYTKTEVDDALALKQDVSSAFSGDYDDLTNKPDLSVYAESADLATVATSGSYNDLSNKPTIPVVPTNVSAFTNDAGYLTQHQSLDNYYTKTETDNAIATAMEDIDLSDYVDVTTFNKKELATAKALTQLNDTKADKTELPDVSTLATKTELNAKANSADLATVATSGSYNDLSDKPVIPEGAVVDAALSDTSENPVQNKVVKGAIDTKQNALQYYRESDDVDDTSKASIIDVNQGTHENYANAIVETYIQYGGNDKTSYVGLSADVQNDNGSQYSNIYVNYDNVSIHSDYVPNGSGKSDAHIDMTNDGGITIESLKGDNTTVMNIQPTGVTINDERVLTESDGVYYISFATIATTGITDADWDGIVAAIDAHRPIYAGYPINDGGILYYGVECMNKNGNNTQIILTSSDDSSHYFYTFTKNGSNDYSYTVETRPYTTAAEKDAWNAKQDAISDLAKIRSGAALGAAAYQKPSTGIPASDIADGVIPTVPTNVSAFTNDAGYLTQHQSLDNYYTKTEIDAMIGNINTILASI